MNYSYLSLSVKNENEFHMERVLLGENSNSHRHKLTNSAKVTHMIHVNKWNGSENYTTRDGNSLKLLYGTKKSLKD